LSKRIQKLISDGNAKCFIGQGEGSNGYSNYFDKPTIPITSNWLEYAKT